MPNYEFTPQYFGSVDYNPYVALTSGEGIELHTSEREGRAYLLVDRHIEYPEHETGTALGKLLLENSSENSTEFSRALLLPENYVTMTQMLNDTIGDNTSDRAREDASKHFYEVGAALLSVVDDTVRRVPRDLSYKHIIFSREDEQPKLLPPMELVEIPRGSREQAVAHLDKVFYNHCMDGAANSTQKRNILNVYNGFKEAFHR